MPYQDDLFPPRFRRATGRHAAGRAPPTESVTTPVSGQRIPFYTVDAFTDTPFAGNPAAVCLDVEDLPDEGMLTIAREMNLSETAFIYSPGVDGLRRLRWFTPAVEVPLCGHATLASAHVILRELGGQGPVRFVSASGPLTIHDEGAVGLRMDFPSDRPDQAEAPPELFHALGIPVPKGRFLRGRNLALLVLDHEHEVMDLAPDFRALGRVDLGRGAMGVAVTASGAAKDVDFVSRVFAPWVGVDEDPVTGVAHTVLTPFWSGELDMQEMEARQGLHRGGRLLVRHRGDRVDLVGHATTVAHGRILRPPTPVSATG